MAAQSAVAAGSGTWPTVAGGICGTPPPAWAVLQRRVFDVLDQGWRLFAARYTETDGRLVYRRPLADRDGVDDFYEAFFNWPMLYVLGGADDLLPAAKRHWFGVTRQLTELGFVHHGFERGYDWFHQGESLLFFYGLCLADPLDDDLRRLATRFADLYLGGPPGNYDPERNLIRAPHNGSGGPRWGLIDGDPARFPGDPHSMAVYGLPLDWLPGIDSFDALLADPRLLGRMSTEMRERMGRGDVAVNLAATGLALNAFLLTGEPRYRDWLVRYVDGWVDRADRNGGILPDNVGLSGQIGEYLGGRWYGGHYGWAWPHGVHSVGTAAVVAAVNAALVTGDHRYLALGRGPIDLVMRHARHTRFDAEPASLRQNWLQRLGPDAAGELHLVPYRHNDSGWFDFHPMQLALPAALWMHGMATQDRERLDDLCAQGGFDWRQVRLFRDKEEAGHEAPWLAYLAGDNPDYPAQALGMALGQIARRLALIAADHADPAEIDLHHWQQVNPVVTEVLLQLTTGAPQLLYNGGTPQLRLRHFDAARRRCGLPPDVAALVERITPHAATLTLVNLSPTATHRILVQAGTFGEHRLDRVRFARQTSDYPGCPHDYRAPDPATTADELPVGGPHLEVILAPAATLRLDLAMTLGAHQPRYRRPWDVAGPFGLLPHHDEGPTHHVAPE